MSARDSRSGRLPDVALYFAYGSNMDRDQMAARCPGATSVGIAVLRDHRFVINRRGVATVAASPGDAVHGVLWQIDSQHRDELDRLEGHHEEGRYDRLPGSVEVDGDRVDCELYIDPDVTRGSPRAGYLEVVVAGASRHGLPAWYVIHLESWA